MFCSGRTFVAVEGGENSGSGGTGGSEDGTDYGGGAVQVGVRGK